MIILREARVVLKYILHPFVLHRQMHIMGVDGCLVFQAPAQSTMHLFIQNGLELCFVAVDQRECHLDRVLLKRGVGAVVLTHGVHKGGRYAILAQHRL